MYICTHACTHARTHARTHTHTHTHLLHCLHLCSRSHTAHRETHIDGRTDSLIEQLGLQEDLSICDGNDVGGDVSRHITSLSLNDGEGSQGAPAVVVIHLGCSLQETRVEVEYITRVGLPTRRTAEKKRHLTVGHSLHQRQEGKEGAGEKHRLDITDKRIRCVRKKNYGIVLTNLAYCMYIRRLCNSTT